LFKGLKLATLVVAGTLALAACGSSSSGGGSSSPSSSGTTSSLKVGMAYDVGGRGDQSFNDAAYAGLSKAASELGVTFKELSAAPSGETDATRQERLVQLAEGGYNPIIAVGFNYAVALGKVATQYPNSSFAIIDDASKDTTKPNIANLTFAEEQGSFLVGAVAAQATKTKNVGYIGGVETTLLKKFQAGFQQGVKAIDPSITVQVKYLTQPPDFSGFGDPAKGQTAAQGMYDNGADVIYTAAGGSGSGAFKAAKPGSTWAIGVDSDQYKQPALAAVKDVILTSMIKRVDVAVFAMVKSCVDGHCLTGPKVFDLASGGVGYSKSNPAVQPYEAKTDELSAKIINGEIKVSATP
jgi:basic membrane protein A and related proteins